MKKITGLVALVILAAGASSVMALPTLPSTPDSGSTMLLLSAGLTGLAVVSRRFRR